MNEASKELRIYQTSSELERLRDALKKWQQKRTGSDREANGKYRGQYQSQVALIVNEVSGAADTIEANLKELTDQLPNLSLGSVFQDCARNDRRIIWLWQAWEYFREKFDQRDDPDLASSVRAADEVLWSCYKPFFEATGITMPPAPLPYIEHTYSPTAVRPDQSSHIEKEEEIDEGPLKRFFANLPLPLLQLPPTVVSAPWAHVLIGHETGHFIQDLIQPKGGYRKIFREKVQAAAKRISPDAESVWGKWAPEIFADLFSVLAMGPWAVWVMGQFELARPGKCTTRGTNYPSALTRIFLMAQFAAKAGLGNAADLATEAGLDPTLAADSEEVKTDLKIAEEVAALIDDSLPDGLPLLREMLDFKAADYKPEIGLENAGEVVQWASALIGGTAKADDTNLRTARMVAAGAAQAWKEVTVMPGGPAREDALRFLRKDVFPHMIACAEGGKRAGVSQPGGQVPLGKIIFELGDDELFG